jgi:predicted AAA+ superfamily ATPase
MAIQVCYNLDSSDGTTEREITALLKISKVLECSNLLIITHSTEKIVEYDNKKIEVVPVWKWLLLENN